MSLKKQGTARIDVSESTARRYLMMAAQTFAGDVFNDRDGGYTYANLNKAVRSALVGLRRASKQKRVRS